MGIRAAIALCITTVTITVAIQSYFKSAKEADFQVSILKDDIEGSKQEILKEMAIRRELRDKEISGIRETMLQLHGTVMDQLKKIDDRVYDMQHGSLNETAYDRSSERDGS